MSPGARAIVEYLAEQLALAEIERAAPAVDQFKKEQQNAASDFARPVLLSEDAVL